MDNTPRVDIVNASFFDRDGKRVLIGGAERYVLALAQLVRDLGLQPRLLQGARRPFVREFEGIEVVGVEAPPATDLAALSPAFIAPTRDASLVVASPVELGVALGGGPVLIGINHGIHWDYANNRVDVHNAAHDAARVAAVLVTDLCVCVDSNFPNWLRCLDARATARTRRIPNFVDLASFEAPDKHFGGDIEVLFPRRLCAERGFRNMVGAFDALLPSYPGLRLHLCGEGPEEDEAIAAAFVERHPGRVRWSRLAMDQMPAAYASSHVVLVPTVFAEGTSLSFLEAAATRNAVVTTAVGGLADLAIDGWNAVVIPPEAQSIVEAVELLLQERDYLQRLATNALTAAAAFSRPRWEARWQHVLHEALPSRVPPPSRVPLPGITAGGLERANLELAQARHDAERELEALCAAREDALRDLAAARAAQSFAEQQNYWSTSELVGIKSSTGWALLQKLYAVRFGLFPRGSRRERLAKGLMHRARAVVGWSRRLRAEAVAPQPMAAHPRSSVVEPPPKTASPLPSSYAVLFLPSIEWSFRRQRPQQMASCLARAGHPVMFAKHGFGAALEAAEVEPGIEELMLPGDPAVNPYVDRMSAEAAAVMADALLEHFEARRLGRFVCIVQLPHWAPLALRLRELAGCDVVYDCMDLHAGFSSNAGDALADEERLVREADLVVASSQVLDEQARGLARRAELIRNGVEYQAFSGIPLATAKAAGRYVIGYYGAIADWFDSALVAAIAALRPAWRIELVGSTWSADTQPLEAAANVSLAGEKPYAELPELIADWDCCIIPFLHTPLTAATNPVKVYEMLASGKPVVSVGLPELVPLAQAGLVQLAEGAEAFVAAIETALRADDEAARQERRAFAASNTWEQRCAQLRAAIDTIVPTISIVVVTFNNRELNLRCLESVLGDTHWPAIEVIVVDNASKDGTPEMLRELESREPRLRIRLNARNRGFAAASNQGAAMASGQYLCFLNNDTVVHGDWLTTLVGHLRRHADLGLVGPVTNAIGNDAQVDVGYADVDDMPAWADRWCASQRGKLEPIAMLAFFCVVVPREVWRRVGPLDERFGVGMFEDDDYNRRVRDAGFEVRVARDSFIHHWQKASFRLLGDEQYLRVYRENEARYRRKWNPPAALAPLVAAANQAPATVVIAPSVGWHIELAQRPHHMARLLARAGYAVAFDCSNAHDPVDTLLEIEPRLFLYRGAPDVLADLPRVIVWTLSYNYDYRDAFGPGARVIYDWIDDLSVFPYDQRKLAALHSRAMREADVVTSVARVLHEQALLQRPDALYVPNGVEAGRFDRCPAVDAAAADPVFANVLEQRRPIAGYYGALARWFDYALLARVAASRQDWSFVLIGPDYDGSLADAGVTLPPNVYVLGARRYQDLPAYLHHFDIAMIPFLINAITLATSPLKLFEYFAGGKPVISSPMPECMAFEQVHIVADAAAFSAALDAAWVESRDADFVARLRAVGASNTWQARVDQVMRALQEREDAPPDVPRRRPARAPAAAAQPATRPASPAASATQEALPPVPEGSDQDVLMRRFAALETSSNRRFFRALARHLGGLKDDPCVAMYFEFALSTNERGRQVAREIERIQPLAGRKVLDVGCAYGGFLVAMGEMGADPMGFDLDELLLGLAVHNFADAGRSYPALRADLMAPEVVAPFADTFDVITCNDVIEHVADPAIAIRHIASMLRPGGLAWFEIPNADAVAFVESDGHYQLFGITQLPPDAARRYYAEHAPGVPYGVGTYLPLERYAELCAAAGLTMELQPPAARADLAEIRRRLAGLRRSLDSRLEKVPAAVREEVRAAVLRYLDGAVAHRGDDASFATRYGDGFWRIVARRRAAVARTGLGEAPAPPGLAHKPFLRGVCNVCGEAARFFRDDPSLDRESLTCEHCRTTARYRSIGKGVLRAIEQRTGVAAKALALLPEEVPGVRFSVYDTQTPFRFEPAAYPLPDILRQRRWIDVTLSGWRPDRLPGSDLGNGVVNQNLERLTFADASFDLVVTSDVMEHVRLDERAHREIARVLKPGGVYVFTVPHFRDRHDTLVRVRVHDPDDPARDEHLTEPEYHGDANAPDGKGVLSYRSYGTVLDQQLCALGFDVAYECVVDEASVMRNAELFYCVKRAG